jgi:hypothetical protein
MTMTDDAAPTAPSQIVDPAETQILERITELEAEIGRLKDGIEEGRKAKQILFLSGGALRDELTRFFTLGLEMPTGASETSKEGFWIIAEAVGEEWCYGEARDSANGNVTREMLARVMLNRGDAGKGDDFPALLVVNTYYEKQDLAQRDQPIPPDVCKRAAEDHILVVRALDLVRIRQKEQSGFAGKSDFLEALRMGGGWFEMNPTLVSAVRTT